MVHLALQRRKFIENCQDWDVEELRFNFFSPKKMLIKHSHIERIDHQRLAEIYLSFQVVMKRLSHSLKFQELHTITLPSQSSKRQR